MRDNRIVLVGDANVDLVVQLPQSSMEKAVGVEFSQPEPQLFGGGTAANSAVALARLGLPVTFLGAVGDDAYGRFVRDDLAREGVNIGAITVLPDAFTPMVIAMIQPNGDRSLVVWPPERGADVQLCPTDLDQDTITQAGWLHTTGMCLRASPVREAVLHAMYLANKAQVPVSFDLNLRLELWGWQDNIRQTVERAIALSDVVFGNAEEEIIPLARVNAVEAAAHILADGKRIVVARHGIQGALAATPGGTVQVPAFEVEQIVDTLGAGDAFNSGFIAARMAGESVENALRWGHAVAALKLGKSGARGLPSRADVEQLLAISHGPVEAAVVVEGDKAVKDDKKTSNKKSKGT